MELLIEYSISGVIQNGIAEYYYNQYQADYIYKPKVGDNLIIKPYSEGADKGNLFYVVGQYKLDRLFIIVLIFVIFVILLSGFRGLSAFIGLGLSVSVLILYLVPSIIAGVNVLMALFVSILLILPASLFMSHGFNKRTLLSIVSILITLFICIFFSWFFVQISGVEGVSTESSANLATNPFMTRVSFSMLYLAGIILATLGILDDVVTAQIAAAEELSIANPLFKFRDLFSSVLNIGREHILGLINTLGVIYFAGSLSSLFAFYIYPNEPLWVTLNRPDVVEEIVRTVSGSLALLFAVPISTLIGAFYFSRIHKNVKREDLNSKKTFSFNDSIL
jgi:uncharacterized membrane protein